MLVWLGNFLGGKRIYGKVRVLVNLKLSIPWDKEINLLSQNEYNDRLDMEKITDSYLSPF